MFNKIMIGLLVFSFLGGTSSAMSILRPFSGNKGKNTVPMSESRYERTIRCKGDLSFDKNGAIIGCSENFYLDEEGKNKQERKMTLKERFLGFLGKLEGMLFWAVIASFAASMLGFGGLVGSLWSNLFGTAAKALRSTVRAISRAKRNGNKIMKELDAAHSANPVVKKRINAERAKVDI